MDDNTAARVACPACKLLGPPISPASAARQLAGLHDDFQHRGQATAIVRLAEQVHAGEGTSGDDIDIAATAA